MGVYLRTSRRTGISLPWWLALPVAACWLAVMAAVLFYGLVAMTVMLAVRGGVWCWRQWQARRGDVERDRLK